MFRLQDEKKKPKEKPLVAKKKKRPISEIIKIDMSDVDQISAAYNEIVKTHGEDKVPTEFLLKVLEGLGTDEKKKGGLKKRSKSPKKKRRAFV